PGRPSSGSDVVELLTTWPCDVVVLDLSMPDLQGLELVRLVRERWPRVAIVIFTMQREDVLGRSLVNAGIYAYVRKTSPPEELVDAVRRAAQGLRTIPDALKAPVAEPEADAPPHTQLSALASSCLLSLVVGGCDFPGTIGDIPEEASSSTDDGMTSTSGGTSGGSSATSTTGDPSTGDPSTGEYDTAGQPLDVNDGGSSDGPTLPVCDEVEEIDVATAGNAVLYEGSGPWDGSLLEEAGDHVMVLITQESSAPACDAVWGHQDCGEWSIVLDLSPHAYALGTWTVGSLPDDDARAWVFSWGTEQEDVGCCAPSGFAGGTVEIDSIDPAGMQATLSLDSLGGDLTAVTVTGSFTATPCGPNPTN
ncbi:MAG: response regulator transcription factor, partial [Myxococcales bacterium]|nr:response regulator transcription factor [Myxococcales bacterium]